MSVSVLVRFSSPYGYGMGQTAIGLKTKPFTFEEWLAQTELPAGFSKWEGAYSHWDQGNPLDFAINIFYRTYRIGRDRQKRSNPKN